MGTLKEIDPQIWDALKNEAGRQNHNINLIASENYASKAVLEAQGSIMTNKYAEGYPGRRYYGGCEFVDTAEELAVNRVKSLFKVEHANVQPHSGAQANMAAYFATLKPGDTVLGMGLDHGGHLTHGSTVNFSAKIYNFIPYGVDRELETIDFNQVEKIAKEHQPKLIVAGATAYTRTIDFSRFRQIADLVGAMLMVDMAHISGLIAGGVHPSCIPHADIVTSTTHKTLRGPRGGIILTKSDLSKSVDRAVFPNAQGGPLMHIVAAKAVAFQEASRPEFAEYQKATVNNARILSETFDESGLRLVSGGTDNHMVLVDLTNIGISGRDAEEALANVDIVVNRNAIPYDTKPPRVASGIRLGSPSVTTRGFGPNEMRKVGQLIIKTLENLDDKSVRTEIRDEVRSLTDKFPAPISI